MEKVEDQRVRKRVSGADSVLVYIAKKKQLTRVKQLLVASIATSIGVV